VSQIRAIAAALPALIAAGLLIWIFALQAKVSERDAALANRDAAVIAANRTIQDQALALAFKDLELDLAQRQVAAGDRAVSAAGDAAAQLRDTLKARKPANASPDHDPPAGPVLVDAAERLRKYGQALAALRAGAADQGAGAPGAADSTGAAEAAFPGLIPPFTQGAFAQACLKIGGALADTVGQLIGIANFQSDYNANVQAANAAARAGAAH
jgi:hypothetical protein